LEVASRAYDGINMLWVWCS